MMQLRKHQAQIDVIIRNICNGEDCTDVIAHVTPGGGKSLIPLLAGRLISEGKADALCWVVPRLTLQFQGEENFVDPIFRKLLGHNLTIRVSTNDSDPCRGLSGHVTTYQALGINNWNALEDFKRRRYVLVLDEFHHLEDNGIWHQAIEPLYKLANYRILMTGTTERGDGREIGFAAKESNGQTRSVRYTRIDALKEQAIIPLKFFLHDGSTKWALKTGKQFEYASFDGVPEEVSGNAVYTAIRTEFAAELINHGVNHWMEYRKIHKRSKMLVVAANVDLAKQAYNYLRNRGVCAGIATYEDNYRSKMEIRRLNDNLTSSLVGVAMFYEGFDCKEISHIVSLTNIRSKPWIEQMVARAVRVDPAMPYCEQHGYIFAPADPKFKTIVKAIEAEQTAVIRKRQTERQVDLFNGKTPEGSEIEPYIIPLESHLSGFEEQCVGHHHHNVCVSGSPFAPQTPSEYEGILRKHIENHVRRYAKASGSHIKRINWQLKEHFGKPRDEMTLDELRRVKEYLLTYFKIDNCRRPAVRRSATRLA